MNLYDFIVIGSGPCGLLSASLLSKNGKTLIVEEGPNVREREKDIYSFSQISSGYIGGGINIAFGSPPILLSEGRCVGGGSSINSSIHHRAPTHIWDKWKEIYDLKGFDKELILSSYEKIENLFAAQKGMIEPSIFYKTAEQIGEKVDRIPRWGIENQEGEFDRWTAKKIFLDEIVKNGSELISHTRYIGAKRKGIFWNIYLKDLRTKKNYKIKSYNLILALGAGKTPIALRKIGLNHINLGKFEIHPSARVSCYFPNHRKSKSIVEPFQITGHFPYLMIGSSATRNELSESSYPFKKNLHGINFSQVQNFYAMAASNTKGKIILKGPFKGLKFYFIDETSKYLLKKGLYKIIEIAKKADANLIYHPGMILDLRIKNNNKYLEKFVISSINKTLCSVHIMSSAAIGENKKFCPLNSNGQVPGIENLLVVDQSTMPTCPTVNPQATACVISLINTNKFLNVK